MRRIVLTICLALGAAAVAPIMSAPEHAGAVGASSPDFNGDGFADLAVGTQGENDSRGLVQILYGAVGGPQGAGSLSFDQDTPGVPGIARVGDNFGSMLAFGDVDADGYDDLAVGALADRVGTVPDAGSVTLFRGSASGLNLHGQLFADDFGTKPSDVVQAGDRFGLGLAMGDYDGNGNDDLAIGVPWDNAYDAGGIGKVKVLLSDDSGGFGESGIRYIARSIIPAQYRSNTYLDGFGYQLATLHGSSPFDGLAVSIPATGTPSKVGVGAVATFRGSGSTLRFAQWLPGLFGVTAYSGSTLAAGDVNNDGEDDIVIGAANASIGRGGVEIARLSNSRAVAGTPWRYTQDSAGFSAINAPYDSFGYSLVVVDAGADAYVYIGTPGDDVGHRNGGGVYVLVGDSSGSPTPLRPGPMKSPFAQTDGLFGLQLSALDATNDGFGDLAVGAPGERVNARIGAGAVYWYDSDGVPPASNGVRFTQNTAGVGGASETHDGFGGTLAFR
jgi:hypothetical protein